MTEEIEKYMLKNKDLINSHIRVYQNYSNKVLNYITDAIKDIFNMHVEINNNVANFEMCGCGYNIYLSRSYIILEEEENTTIENIYTVDNIEELIDLIKDLRDDN